MNMIPPPMIPSKAPRATFGQATASASSLKWAALQDAANVVAVLFGLCALIAGAMFAAS